jgi:hypothetical protein
MLVLPKQAGDALHRKKETASDGGKPNKPEMLIELYRTRIDCIHDDRGRGDSVHFTPTHSSWLNQVEIRFSKLQHEVIDRGIFNSVADLRRRILR